MTFPAQWNSHRMSKPNTLDSDTVCDFSSQSNLKSYADSSIGKQTSQQEKLHAQIQGPSTSNSLKTTYQMSTPSTILAADYPQSKQSFDTMAGSGYNSGSLPSINYGAPSLVVQNNHNGLANQQGNLYHGAPVKQNQQLNFTNSVPHQQNTVQSVGPSQQQSTSQFSCNTWQQQQQQQFSAHLQGPSSSLSAAHQMQPCDYMAGSGYNSGSLPSINYSDQSSVVQKNKDNLQGTLYPGARIEPHQQQQQSTSQLSGYMQQQQQQKQSSTQLQGPSTSSNLGTTHQMNFVPSTSLAADCTQSRPSCRFSTDLSSGSSYNTESLPFPSVEPKGHNNMTSLHQYPDTLIKQHQQQQQNFGNVVPQQQNAALQQQSLSEFSRPYQQVASCSMVPPHSKLSHPSLQQQHQQQQQMTSTTALPMGQPQTSMSIFSRAAILKDYVKRHTDDATATQANTAYYKQAIQLDIARLEKTIRYPDKTQFYDQFYEDEQIKLFEEIINRFCHVPFSNETPVNVQASMQNLHGLCGFSQSTEDSQECNPQSQNYHTANIATHPLAYSAQNAPACNPQYNVQQPAVNVHTSDQNCNTLSGFSNSQGSNLQSQTSQESNIPPHQSAYHAQNVPAVNPQSDVRQSAAAYQPAPNATETPNPAKNHTLETDAIKIMEHWYKENATNPYPKRKVMETMAQQGGITFSQVNKWFCNKRQRSGFAKNNPDKRIRGKKRNFSEQQQLAQQEMQGAQAKRPRK